MARNTILPVSKLITSRPNIKLFLLIKLAVELLSGVYRESSD